MLKYQKEKYHNEKGFQRIHSAFGIDLKNRVYSIGITYSYNPNFPYFLYPDIDWDEPVKVENEHLHKALSAYFRDLKGIEGYTRRDLSLITKLETTNFTKVNEKTSETVKCGRIYIYLKMTYTKVHYPDYYENADRGPKGTVVPPASQYYTVEGEWIEDIPQSDMDLFIALGY